MAEITKNEKNGVLGLVITGEVRTVKKTKKGNNDFLQVLGADVIYPVIGKLGVYRVGQQVSMPVNAKGTNDNSVLFFEVN